MFRNKRLGGALAIISLVLGILSSNPMAIAQGTGGGSGLSISPTRTELNLEPGTTDKVQITIKNVTSGSIIAKPFINDFESDNSLGEPKLYANIDQRNSASIFNFLSGLKDITLAPGESANLEYPITIPSDAAPGAYYGAVAYRAVPSDRNNPESGEVALTANVATLVLIEVPGNITEKIQILDIKAMRGDSGGNFFTRAPNKIGVTIKNLGNSFSKPFGTVIVKNTFGREVYKFEVNNLIPKGNILPNSQRIFREDIHNVSMPGRYTIDANISHGRGGEILNFQSSFWYLPTWFIITIIVLLALIIGLGFFLYTRIAKKRISNNSSHR